jgi:hypothetical protein
MNSMRYILIAIISFFTITIIPSPVFAGSGGISAAGGGTKTVGQNFTVTVTASGDEFDSLQGTVSVSGPVSIVSFSPGSVTWLPGKTPSNGAQFVGITSATKSVVVARVTLKGTQTGSGSVSVSGVKLARNGSIVGTSGTGTSFTINRALSLPGGLTVASTTHPDPNTSYENTTIDLSWNKPDGVTEFSYYMDDKPETVPAAQKTSAETSTQYASQPIGTYFFHIRAKNNDGWGNTTHFKITIKEPDAKIDPSLAAPTISKVDKGESFSTDINEGNVAGLIITGQGLPGYTINLTLSPTITLPEGATLSASIGEDGQWKVAIDSPIHAGFYRLVAQGQKEKILTPLSEPKRFELSVAKGGDVRFISDKDAQKETVNAGVTNKSGAAKVLGYMKHPITWIAFVLMVGVIVTSFIIHRKNRAN